MKIEKTNTNVPLDRAFNVLIDAVEAQKISKSEKQHILMLILKYGEICHLEGRADGITAAKQVYCKTEKEQA